MESKLADERKGDDVESSDIPFPNQRLYSRNSSLPSSVRSSEFEEPLHADNVGNGAVLSKEGSMDRHPDDGESSLQSPTMEQPPDSCGYRIPPYVFAKNRSGNPMEWSINSNDSLFSIQMGTTSFTHDQINRLTKSEDQNGEAYQHLDSHQPASPDDLNPSVEPSEPPNTETSTDINAMGITSASTEPTTSGIEPAAGHPGKGESEINADHNSSNTKSSLVEEQTRDSAHCSDASGQSFAFPLLAGELNRGNSVKSNHTSQEKLQEKTRKQSPHKPSSSNTGEVHAETREPAQSTSWFSGCFSCCSHRS